MKHPNRIIIIIFIAVLVFSVIPLIKIVSKQKTRKPMDAMKKILYQSEEVPIKPDIRQAEPAEINQQTIFDKFKRLKDIDKAQEFPVEITGPLTERTVVSAYLPVYPEWLKNKGEKIEVVLWFHVLPKGTVKDDISITRSSGYEEIDKIAIKALKEWIFLPADEQKEQWGQINFRYNP